MLIAITATVTSDGTLFNVAPKMIETFILPRAQPMGSARLMSNRQVALFKIEQRHQAKCLCCYRYGFIFISGGRDGTICARQMMHMHTAAF